MIARIPVRRVRLGPPRRGSALDEAYLRWLRSLPCVVCNLCMDRSLYLRVESAHVGMRGLGQRCPDRETIPLCVWHHTGGPHAVHVLGRKFWQYWSLDRFQLIADFNDRYEREKAA